MKYKLRIGRDNRIFGITGEEFEEGEEIRFRIPLVTDSTISVTSSDVDYIRQLFDEDYNYSFIMPGNDVTINIEMKNNMMNTAPSPMMSMGMLSGGMGMMQMPAGQSAGKMKFCRECGSKLEYEGQEICPVCGQNLK